MVGGLVAAGVAAAAGTGAWLGLRETGEYPQDTSTADLPEPDQVAWFWTGGVTSSAASVVVGLADIDWSTEPEVVVHLRAAGGQATSQATSGRANAAAGAERVYRVHFGELQSDTTYTVSVHVDGRPDAARGEGSFATFPEGAASFRVAFGSCARTGSNAAVFDAIVRSQPALYLCLGDLHYGNLASSDPADHRAELEVCLTSPAQSHLYRNVASGWFWDDHDYGPDDSDATSPSRSAAQASYQAMVPHYPLPDEGGAIYQSFTIGRVRFIATDARSERRARTMLGERQLSWFIDELVSASASHAAVVWASPTPWVGQDRVGIDTWPGFPEERRQIADALAQAGVTNLVMIAGDVHMVALDDGTNTDFSTNGHPGFPVLLASPLDQVSKANSGDYSAGFVNGNGQFGTVDVLDEGSDITITLSGRNWRDEVLLQHVFGVPA